MERKQRLVSRAEFARRLPGLSRQTVYKHCSKRLKEAMVGDQLDLNHPLVYEFIHTREYIEPDAAAIADAARKGHTLTPGWQAKGPKPTQVATSAPPAPEKRQQETQNALEELGLAEMGADEEMQDAETWLSMSVREVALRYGTYSRFKELANAAKSLVQMRGYEDDQARKRKDHIPRVHAERLVAHIDGLHKALLSDNVTNIVTTLEAQIKAGADKQELEKTLRTVISRTIKLTKEQSARGLRDVTK